MVKQAATILFCTLFFIEAAFPQVELSDLARLPELFQHFRKHREEAPEISFAEFLALHYGDSQHVDLDKNHKKLPFSKAHHVVASLQVIHNSFSINTIVDRALLMEIDGVYYFEKQERPVSLPIWQPPKI
jgi:hypothetical protein